MSLIFKILRKLTTYDNYKNLNIVQNAFISKKGGRLYSFTTGALLELKQNPNKNVSPSVQDRL